MQELDVRKRYADYEGVMLSFYIKRDYNKQFPWEGRYIAERYDEFHRFYSLLTVLGANRGDLDMAKNSNGKFVQVDFVNIDWQDKHEEMFEAWQKKHANDWHLKVTDMLANQYKFGLTWDDNNACYIVSVTCKDDRSSNANMCFTARSDDWTEAMQIAIFKHYEICGEDWTTSRKKGIRG